MLINFFRNWKLRIKLLVSFLTLLLVALSLSIILYFSYSHFIKLEQSLSKLEYLKYQLKKEELSIKTLQHEIYKNEDFHTGKLLPKSELIDAKNNLLESVNSLTGQSNRLDSQLILVRKNIIKVSDLKLTMHENLLKRGFKDKGLEGKLRDAVHAVEQIEGIDKVLVLSLRRHEKDFMLRKELKYVDDFNKKISILESTNLNATSNEKEAVIKNINTYKKSFNALVDIEKVIGLNDDLGIRKEIKNFVASLNQSIQQIENNLKEQINKEKTDINLLLLVASAIVIFVSIILSLQFANLITKVIKEIRGGMQTFAAGNLPDKLPVLSTEEIGQTKIAFNQLIDRLHAAQTYAVKLGNGKFDDSYPEEFANDLLAQALVKASKELQIADTVRKENEYVNQAIAKLSEVVSNKEESLEQLAHRVLSVFIEYFQANQGIVYAKGLFSESELQTKPVAFYAYNKKKSLTEKDQHLPPLVEQCMLEKEIIYLEEVPGNYIKVTSGLGEALPSSVALVPMLYRTNCIGVIELAFFTTLNPLQISLLQKLSTQAAAIIESKTSETVESKKNQHLNYSFDVM